LIKSGIAVADMSTGETAAGNTENVRLESFFSNKNKIMDISTPFCRSRKLSG